MLFHNIMFICFVTATVLYASTETVGYRTVYVAKNSSRQDLIDRASEMFIEHHERLVEQLCQKLNSCDIAFKVEVVGADELTVRATVSGCTGSGDAVTLTLAETFDVVRFGR